MNRRLFLKGALNISAACLLPTLLPAGTPAYEFSTVIDAKDKTLEETYYILNGWRVSDTDIQVIRNGGFSEI